MKKNVALIYGGRSVEHEISVRSAQNVAQYIDKDLFDLCIIGIDKKGDWYHTRKVTSEIEGGTPVSLVMKASSPEIQSRDLNFKPDIVFPVLHGTDGEDGSIQGLLHALNIVFVGSGVLGSAIAMDKIISKKLLQSAGIPVVPFKSYSRQEKKNISFKLLKEEIGLPFMIKASNLGSSVGVTKVVDESSFKEGLEEGFAYANEVLVESFIKGMEVECAIMGNNPPESTWPGEVHLKKDYDFYTYEAKYQDADAIDMVIPAPLSEDIQKEVRKLSEAAYVALKCNDFARVDVFVSENNEVFVNEINTIPGFTNVSMFPSMWENMGITYQELITKLINLAEHRWNEENQLQTHYKKA